MTLERINQILDSDRRMYYRTHELNDKLYIHFQGFRKLQNLQTFTGLRSLFAEANAIEKIEGLEHCTKLRSLFLQQNCVKTMEGMENCTDLWNLNLSENWVETIEGIEHLRHLNSINLQKNRIGINGLRDVIGLRDTNLATVDLSDNKVADPEVIPQVFARMSSLRVLYLKGNPVVKQIPHYRKTVIAMLPELKYLDDRPVFVEDRRTSEAFVAGGLEGERECRRIMKQEKEESHKRQMMAFKKMVEDAKEARREAREMRKHDKYTDETDPVETWKQRQERFIRENPQYDYEEHGRLDKKPDGKPPAERKPDPAEKEPDSKGQDLEKPSTEKLAKGQAEPPPPVNWDEDIFGGPTKAAAEPAPNPRLPVGGWSRNPEPAAAPKAALKAAPKAAAKEADPPAFQPPPRAPAAFGPRGHNVNELDELD